MCVDDPNDEDYSAPPMTQRPPLRYCNINNGRCNCGQRYRYPPRAGSNDHVHRNPSFNRCIGCRSGPRSSIESVNSAPGRMDHNDLLCEQNNASLLDPMRRVRDGSEESLVSGIARLDGSEENINKMNVSPTGLQRHYSDCLHASRPTERGHRVRPMKPQRYTPPPPWNNNNPEIHTPPDLYRDAQGRVRRSMDEGSAGLPSDDDTTVSGTYTIDTAAASRKLRLRGGPSREDGTVV
jgi:hypothetical protein